MQAAEESEAPRGAGARSGARGPLTVGGPESGPDAPRGERFPRRARIRSGDEIGAALREGGRRRRGPVEVFCRPSPAGRPRVGFVVPRHGRSVADRNRLKRRLREIARREWLPGAVAEGTAVDVVIRARPGAYEAGFEELRASLLGGLEAAACEASS